MRSRHGSNEAAQAPPSGTAIVVIASAQPGTGLRYRLKMAAGLMLEAYFDDSGKEADKSNRFVCIAGYLSLARCWEAFNRKWGGLLDKHQLPELHMKHWKTVTKQKAWTDQRASAVLNDFVDVIERVTSGALALASMRTSGGLYHKKKRTLFGSAQEFAMQRIFRMIIDVMCEHDLIDYLNLAFDQDEEFSKPRLTRYYGVRKFDLLVKSHAAIISFADAKVCYCLQAADLLAYLTRARLLDRTAGRPETPQWKRLMTPFEGRQLQYRWDGWTGPDLAAELDEALSGLSVPE